MDETRVNMSNCLAALPEPWPDPLLPKIREQVTASGCKVVVLDDDPTGTQTVHRVPVLTEWSVPSLRAELEDPGSVVYVLTNSRSRPLAEAESINRQIGRNLVEASRRAGRRFVVVSRSDSTLRGHFPGEVDALAGALGQRLDGWLLVPFFLEGGRLTIHDVHYVAEGQWLVPAGRTESARDASFGYRSSNLRRWVEEKTAGRVPYQRVASISLDEIRRGGPERVTRCLGALADGQMCVVNAAAGRDLEVFVWGLLAAEAQGKRFLYRTAASFVQVRAGLAPRGPLTRADLNVPEAGGGLMVIGSYVPRTTRQLDVLLDDPTVIGVEANVEVLMDHARRWAEIRRVAAAADRGLRRGRDVAIFTSRRLVTGDDAESSLSVGGRVSEGLVSIVRALSAKPCYLLAKGGITSSDVATEALGVRRAEVLGQIVPGVPVWKLGPESRYPGMAYIVFPGNVGGRDALLEIVRSLQPHATGR